MNHTMAIARREISEKAFVFIAAAALAVVASLMPFVPGVQSNHREVVVVAATVCAVGLALGMSLMLGASVIGRDLTDRRLSFYLAKPISAPAIWFGKIAACAVLIAGAFAIALSPALFAGAVAFRRVFSGASSLFLAVSIGATASFFIAHVISTIVRSRSLWALADFAALAAFAFIAWVIAQPLLTALAFSMLAIIVKTAAWLLLAAVIVVGAWQLAVGRTDRQQSHFALSQFLWPACAAVLLICGTIVWWVVSATPSDLQQVQTITASGDWVIVGGTARHRADYRPLFAMNINTGAYQRLGGGRVAVQLTDDRRSILLVRPLPTLRGAPAEIVRRDLGSGSEVATGLFVPSVWTPVMAVSSDGNRIVYNAANVIAVYDTADHRSLGSFRIEQARRAVFVSPDLLRVYAGSDVLRIFECDLRRHAMQMTGAYTPHYAQPRYLQFQLLGSNVGVPTGQGGTAILNGRTAAPIETIAGTATGVLGDGRIISLQGNVVRVGSRTIAIGDDLHAVFAREVLPGKILVQARHTTSRGLQLLVIDADSGRVLHRQENLYAVARSRGANVLAEDATGSLVRLDALTGAKKVLLTETGR